MYLPALRIPITPAHAIHATFPRVWMLPNARPMIAATATNTAVQVPCVESEFNPMLIPSIAEAESIMKSMQISPVLVFKRKRTSTHRC